MEEISSLWSYQEGVDEMRQRLLCTGLEFEQFKAESSEEIGKINEYICELIQLVKLVSQERDEAREHLQKLLNKLVPSSTNPSQFISNFSLSQNESPVLSKQMKAGNSSITESNSLSDVPVNHNSQTSSPVDSFFNAVSSPDLSNNVVYMPHQKMIVQDSNLNVSMEMPKVDHANLMIDNIIKGKALPQKGKLLQAVLEAPQLLQTLLLAGPLPEWRNPPRPQTFQAPPFSIQKDAEIFQPNHYVQMSKRQRLQ